MKINSTRHKAKDYETPSATLISMAKPMHLLRRFSVVEMDIDDFIDGEDF